MKRKIIVSVINSITYDQRLEKVCESLKDKYAIEIIGSNINGLPKLERPYKTTRLPLWFKKSALLYIEFSIRLFFTLLFKTDKNTILLANDMDTLLPNYWISKIKKIPLVFDAHEIFSELPSVKGRYSQKIWLFLEKQLIPNQKYFYTVSESYANWYYKNYGIQALIIKNFPRKKVSKPFEKKENWLIYQGALNKGRGLEKMIMTMHYFPNLILKIFGEGPLKIKLEELAKKENLSHIVHFEGNIFPEELFQITPKALLGLSLEEDRGLSYRYALPNKIFDYVQAGIPIIGTFLPEIKHIITKYNIGEVIIDHDENHIKKAIEAVLEKPESFYKENLTKAAQELVWENQEAKLLALFERVAKEHK